MKRRLAALAMALSFAAAAFIGTGMKAEARIPSRADYEDIFANRGEYAELSWMIGYNGEIGRGTLDKAVEVVGKAPVEPHNKVKYFHDWICDNTVYEIYGGADSEAAGVFYYGKAKCSGYASAFKLLCTLADIPCYIVGGYSGEPHAWNIVQLEDGEWYEVDCTWDDKDSSVPSGITYDYFLITTDEMNRNHTRGAVQVDKNLPIAYGTTYRYKTTPIDLLSGKLADYKMKADGTLEYLHPAKDSGDVIYINSTVVISGKRYNVTSIAKDAFKGNSKIYSVKISKGIEEIGEGAFMNCKKLHVVDMSGCDVSVLEKNLFANDKKLEKITVNGNLIKKANKGAFKKVPSYCDINVNASSKAKASRLIKKLKKAGAKKCNFKFKKRK